MYSFMFYYKDVKQTQELESHSLLQLCYTLLTLSKLQYCKKYLQVFCLSLCLFACNEGQDDLQ